VSIICTVSSRTRAGGLTRWAGYPGVDRPFASDTTGNGAFTSSKHESGRSVLSQVRLFGFAPELAARPKRLVAFACNTHRLYPVRIERDLVLAKPLSSIHAVKAE
jgi:hypothetical protein